MPSLQTPPDLPLHLDEVTPQWLTGALSSLYPGIRIAAARRQGDRFGTSASARFDLTYAETAEHSGLPAAVYVKGGFADRWRKRAWMALQQEARFYAEVAPHVTLNIPRAYYCAINDAPQGIVILEDISDRGVRFGANLAPVTVDDVAAVLGEIARMHAEWWQSTRLPPYMEWGRAQRMFLKNCHRPTHWEEVIARKHGKLLVQAMVSPETAVRALETLWAIQDAKPRTFVHGDLHGGNIYYERDGRPGFLDWQLCFAGNYVHDMSWVIVTAFDVEQRRGHEASMIRHYLAELKRRRGEAPGFDEAWLAHRQNMAHAVTSYGALPHDNGPLEVMEGAAERAYHAALDLECLASLGLPGR